MMMEWRRENRMTATNQWPQVVVVVV